MKFLLAFILITQGVTAQVPNLASWNYLSGPNQCMEKETTEEPFMVSDASGMGWKSYENFRSKDNYQKKENILPRRSIVKVKKGSSEYANSPDSYVPVEVIGVADTDYHDDKLLKSRLSSASAMAKFQKLGKAYVGKKGFLYSKSLKKADEYTYILKEDSPILADNGLSEMGVAALKPVKSNNGKYIIDLCCDVHPASSLVILSTCKKNYRFKVVYADQSEGKELSIDIASCNIAESLIPFKDDNITAMMNFMKLARGGGSGFDDSKIEFIDEKGLVKMPLDYTKTDGQGTDGPFGSYHYNLDDEGASDAYAQPLTTCAFMKVLEEHQKKCIGDGCQIQFGDMFHLRKWGPHEYHNSGKCIDIRPLKKTDDKLALTYKDSNYDREKTKKFIKLLKKAGGASIVFDDPKIEGTLKTSNGSHNNHIHVCFDPKDQKVQDTCYKGL